MFDYTRSIHENEQTANHNWSMKALLVNKKTRDKKAC